MAKFKLTGGFERIPEGTYIFRIDKVEYDQDFGKMNITLKTSTGRTHIETFRFLKGDGKTVNDGAMAAFSYLTRIAMNDMDLEELDDEQMLVGKYFKATVEHEQTESTKNPGQMYTNVRLNDKEPASGFEDEGFMPVEEESSDADDLLASLLG